MRRTTRPRKLRKTYTLSAEAVAVIEHEKRTRRTRSASFALEALLREKSRQQRMINIAASISNYYDSLSEEQMNEDRLWGAFAETQFPLE